MTIEEIVAQIVDKSGAELKAMSDEQLLEHFKELLPETRPELVQQRKRQQQAKLAPVQLRPQAQFALEQLAEAGIDISFLERRRRRK